MKGIVVLVFLFLFEMVTVQTPNGTRLYSVQSTPTGGVRVHQMSNSGREPDWTVERGPLGNVYRSSGGDRSRSYQPPAMLYQYQPAPSRMQEYYPPIGE